MDGTVQQISAHFVKGKTNHIAARCSTVLATRGEEVNTVGLKTKKVVYVENLLLVLDLNGGLLTEFPVIQDKLVSRGASLTGTRDNDPSAFLQVQAHQVLAIVWREKLKWVAPIA
jgi:hypothetical protein